MTKGELNQEAREYVSNYQGYGWKPNEGSAVFTAMIYSYMDSAEPREKLIEEQRIKIKKMKELLNEIYSEFGFSELVKVRNNLPIEIQDLLKEIEENG